MTRTAPVDKKALHQTPQQGGEKKPFSRHIFLLVFSSSCSNAPTEVFFIIEFA